MAKLNYDKDVKHLVNKVNDLIEGKVEIRSKVDTWVMMCNKTPVYEGTLRDLLLSKRYVTHTGGLIIWQD